MRLATFFAGKQTKNNLINQRKRTLEFRLFRNWKACSYQLRPLNCFIANYDAVMQEKNPKYTPLTRTKASKNREENIDLMAELYRIKCERFQMNSFGGGPGQLDFDADYDDDEGRPLDEL